MVPMGRAAGLPSGSGPGIPYQPVILMTIAHTAWPSTRPPGDWGRIESADHQDDRKASALTACPGRTTMDETPSESVDRVLQDGKAGLPSRHSTVGPQRAPHRAFLYALGLSRAQMAQPFVAVVSTWNEAAPCSIALSRQAHAVKNGVSQCDVAVRRRTNEYKVGGIAHRLTGILQHDSVIPSAITGWVNTATRPLKGGRIIVGECHRPAETARGICQVIADRASADDPD